MKVPPGNDMIFDELEGHPKPENDFSEYLWMENEEEFDNEVMRQLEEEALMEQCIQAMLEDEQESSPGFHEMTACLENLDVRDKKEIVQNSKLNPNAAEFVPRTNPSSVA